MSSTRRWAGLAGLALAVAACGGGTAPAGAPDPASSAADPPAATAAPTPTDAAAPADPQPDAAPDAGAAAIVPAALQFAAPLVGGGELDLATLAGKPTLLWFWAPT